MIAGEETAAIKKKKCVEDTYCGTAAVVSVLAKQILGLEITPSTGDTATSIGYALLLLELQFPLSPSLSVCVSRRVKEFNVCLLGTHFACLADTTPTDLCRELTLLFVEFSHISLVCVVWSYHFDPKNSAGVPA